MNPREKPRKRRIPKRNMSITSIHKEDCAMGVKIVNQKFKDVEKPQALDKILNTHTLTHL